MPDSGSLELLDGELASDGTYASDLCLDPYKPLYMNGRSVIMHASRKVPAAIRTVLQRHDILPDEVAAFLLHQANQNLIVKIAGALKVPVERFYSNIARYGNTSSASMLIAAAEWSRVTPKMKPGTPVVFAAFGAGFHWGSVLARARSDRAFVGRTFAVRAGRPRPAGLFEIGFCGLWRARARAWRPAPPTVFWSLESMNRISKA